MRGVRQRLRPAAAAVAVVHLFMYELGGRGKTLLEPRRALSVALGLLYDQFMLLEGAELAAPAARLNDLLRVGLGAGADDTALVSIARSMSWRELEDESAALAVAYLSLGLREGDRIASLMPNRVDLVVHYLACFKAGSIITPLNYRYTFREI